MNDTDFIGVYNNVISDEICKKIINYFEFNLNNFENSYIYHGSNEAERKHLTRHDYQIYLKQDDPAFKLIQTSLHSCWQLYKKKYWTSDQIDIWFEEVKLQKTPPRGGFHDWHCEVFHLSTVDRALVWMLYLNDIPEGEGETEFLWQGLRVQPKAGTMLIWPAFYTHIHRGNAVYSYNKYIATGYGNYINPHKDEYVYDYFEEDEKIGYYDKK